MGITKLLYYRQGISEGVFGNCSLETWAGKNFTSG